MIQIGAPSATLDTPVEHLTACHRRIEQRLDTLVAAAGHLESDLPGSLAAIANSLRFLDSNGVLHTEDEEVSVFPRLRPTLSPQELAYVDSLELQHDEAEAIYAELKRLVAALDSPTPEAIAQYRACAARLRTLYRAHIQSEDDILTRLARRSLRPADLAAISAEMRARRAPV